MDPRLVNTFGPRFLVDDVRDLELLTDLLAASRDHLNVLLAAASYLEQIPNGMQHFKPALRARLQHSADQLHAGPHARVPAESESQDRSWKAGR